MNFVLKNRHGLRLLPVAASLWLAAAAATAQTPAPAAPAASMPMGQMQHKGMAGAKDMKASMMMGMDGMQNMKMSGDTDKDFATMMKMHHQQAVHMSELELAQGKSPEMKAMAKKIIAAQKKEIAELDRWIAKQK